MDKKSNWVGVVLAITGMAVGFAIGHQQSPSKEQVRTALYKVCVNGPAYKPDSDDRGSLVCNRRSIDLTMATIYGDSYIEPMPDAEARAKYESALAEYKHK